MNRNLHIIAGVLLVAGSLFGSCSPTEWDAENGWDTNKGEEGNMIDSIQGIDLSMYDKARVFPGLVDTLTEVRVDTTVNIDMSKRYVNSRSIGFYTETEVMPQPIYSTGLYAGAGELVAIEVPEGNNFGLTVQIGMQVDDLSDLETTLRQPIVYMKKSLYPGKNQVRFPLGGYIWILREPLVEADTQLALTFKGVYAAPDFIKGVTDPNEWQQKLNATTVPWLELRGDNVTISIDRNQLVSYASGNPNYGEDVEKILQYWDDFLPLYYKSYGLYAGNTTSANRAPDFSTRFVFDVQLQNNLIMETTNPQGFYLVKTAAFYDELVQLTNVQNGDFSNMYKMLDDKYTFFYTPFGKGWKEGARYVPWYRYCESLIGKGMASKYNDMGINFNLYTAKALKYAAAGTDSIKRYASDAWWKGGESASSTYAQYSLLLTMLAQLAKYEAKYQGKNEWNFYETLWTMARNNKNQGNDIVYFFEELCKYYNTNFTPFFDHLGITLSSETRIAAERYPLLDKEIWNINPASSNPCSSVVDYNIHRFPYRLSTAGWTIRATDATYENENYDREGYTQESNYHKADLLIDGDINTYWASYLAAKKDDDQDSPYDQPYYILIDMGEEKTMNGCYIGNGNNKYVSEFVVQGSNATDAMENKNALWTTLKTVSQTAMTAKTNEQFYDFSRTEKYRYLRIVLSKPNLLQPEESEESKEAFIKLHKSRKQRINEFGVYQYR